MRVIELYPVLAACLLASITGVTGVALPDGRPSFTLMRRQDDGEVEAESTEKLRKCREPKPIYIDQDTVNWHERNNDKTKLEVTVTTTRGENDIPEPKGTDKGDRFVVDHTLELQVVVEAFDQKNREYNDDAKAISDEAWQKAHDAVNGGDSCIKVAESVTVLDNLLGIAEKINVGKQVIFTKVVKDRTDTPLNGKWDEYLKVIGTYLDDFKTKVETAADNTGGAIQGFTNDKHISTYFATYCKDKYTAGQDYVKAQLAKQDGAEEPADGAGTGQCLPLGTDCTNDINSCCSKACWMDKGKGAYTCQGADP